MCACISAANWRQQTSHSDSSKRISTDLPVIMSTQSTRHLLRKLLNRCLTSREGGTAHRCMSSVKTGESLTTGDYDTVYRNSIDKREDFYNELAQKITWHRPYNRVLDPNSLPTEVMQFAIRKYTL